MLLGRSKWIVNFARFRKNEEIRKVFRNFSYLSCLQIANYIFPLITLPYLARVVGVEAFGSLVIGTSVVAYFQTFTDYGFAYTSVKEIARNKEDIKKVSQVVCETMVARIFLMIVSFCILSLCIYFIPFVYANREIILLTFLLIPGHILFADWFFQGMEDMKYIAMLDMFSKLLFTILVFVVVRERSDYIYQPVLISIGYAVSAMFCLWIMRKRYGVVFYVPPVSSILKRIKRGFNIFLSIFLPSIYTNINTLLLGGFNGEKATGIYSGGAKFTSLAYNVISLFSRVFYPYLSRRPNSHKTYSILIIAIGALISLFLFFGADIIVIIFLGEEFMETIPVLRIVAFTPLAMSIMNAYGINSLVLRGKDNILRNIIFVSTIFGLIMGIYGAVNFSYIGVAICSLLIQYFRAILVFVYARKNHN